MAAEAEIGWVIDLDHRDPFGASEMNVPLRYPIAARSGVGATEETARAPSAGRNS